MGYEKRLSISQSPKILPVFSQIKTCISSSLESLLPPWAMEYAWKCKKKEWRSKIFGRLPLLQIHVIVSLWAWPFLKHRNNVSFYSVYLQRFTSSFHRSVQGYSSSDRIVAKPCLDSKFLDKFWWIPWIVQGGFPWGSVDSELEFDLWFLNEPCCWAFNFYQSSFLGPVNWKH